MVGKGATASDGVQPFNQRILLPLGNSRPLTPSSIVPPNPPLALAMTGTPLTIASIATSPSGSAQSEGATRAQASSSSRSTSMGGAIAEGDSLLEVESCGQIVQHRPLGPLPTIRRRAPGSSARTRAKARSKSGRPFSTSRRPQKTKSGSPVLFHKQRRD